MSTTLFVLGSPRKNGNSDCLAKTAAGVLQEAGQSVSFLALREYPITPCRGCGGCSKTGKCVIGSDSMKELYEVVNRAHNLVMVSPVYFYGVTGQMKNFIDRCQPYWAEKYLLGQGRANSGRNGFFIGCAATSGKKVFDGCLLTVKCLFDALDIVYRGELLVRGVDEKGAVEKEQDFLDAAVEFGTQIASY